MSDRDDVNRAVQVAMAAYERASGKLCMFVIYEHPTDFPDYFVARMFVVDEPSTAFPVVICDISLAEVRKWLPQDRVLLMRHPSDDPVIVETWV